MHRINPLHAKRFDRKYVVTGHLHEGRYRALLIEEDVYLLRLVRYIHQNPVRAGLVASVNDWAYSSHREYGEPDTWVDAAPVLQRFSTFSDYQQFVGDSASPNDVETFSRPARGFRYAGTYESVEKLAEKMRPQTTHSPRLWLPLGQARLAPKHDIEQDTSEWLTANEGTTSLEGIQGPDIADPVRSSRRLLVSFLRERRHSLRSIAAVIGRQVPAVSKILLRAAQQRQEADTQQQRTLLEKRIASNAPDGKALHRGVRSAAETNTATHDSRATRQRAALSRATPVAKTGHEAAHDEGSLACSVASRRTRRGPHGRKTPVNALAKNTPKIG